MASPLNVLFCAVAAVLFWTGLGLPLARRLAPEQPLRWALAPIMGWAVFSPLAVLIFPWVGFTRTSIAILVVAALGASLALAIVPNRPEQPATAGVPAIPWWAFAAAALLAAAPAIGIMPKFVDGGVILATPIFDHAKVAIIDDIARLGLPAGNPFFGDDGSSAQLAYYYLWHFSAAIFAVLLGVSGWEADAAFTWFTAFASLLLMMGLAVWFSGRRAAAVWVILLSIAGSLRPILTFALGERNLEHILSPYSGLQTWVVQASWAPQHLASAACVVVAVFLMSRLTRHGGPLGVAALALVVAAAFESSAWVGGITFAVVAGPVSLGLLVTADPKRRLGIAASAIAGALLAVLLALPFIRNEYLATVTREAGFPIALHPLAVLGTFIPQGIRRVLDLPAYWFLLLIIEFPATYIAGSFVLARALKSRETPDRSTRPAMAFGLLVFVCLAVGWLLVSTIANNDLGWRAALPAVLVLTVFAAVGFSRWRTYSAPAAVAASALLLLGLPGGLGFIGQNAMGNPSASAAPFADTADLWRAVRRHAAPDQRVGNNPLSFADLTVWPINISWSLLADRRSCYAGWALARAFVALPGAEIDAVDGLFVRVFAGEGSVEDVHLLATRYGCHAIILSAQDGAWRRDPFADSPDYRLAEEAAAKWRLYVATQR